MFFKRDSNQFYWRLHPTNCNQFPMLHNPHKIMQEHSFISHFEQAWTIVQVQSIPELIKHQRPNCHVFPNKMKFQQQPRAVNALDNV